jgi:hypothetical protein
MKRLLNAVVWCVFAAALLIKKHRDRREKRDAR